MTSRTLRGYAAFAEMPAPPEALWPWLVEPARLMRWYAASIELEPRTGGRFTARFADGAVLSARIECCDTARRLSLAFDPAAAWPGAACITEDWIIDARPGRVMLRILGEGVPAEPAWSPWLRRRQAGWKVALARLRAHWATPPAATPAAGP
ncbi:MAG: SRPBCC domain-containing protein [Gammaproteobacteria bacterium]